MPIKEQDIVPFDPVEQIARLLGHQTFMRASIAKFGEVWEVEVVAGRRGIERYYSYGFTAKRGLPNVCRVIAALDGIAEHELWRATNVILTNLRRFPVTG